MFVEGTICCHLSIALLTLHSLFPWLVPPMVSGAYNVMTALETWINSFQNDAA